MYEMYENSTSNSIVLTVAAVTVCYPDYTVVTFQ